MKRLKRIMALVIAMAMVVASLSMTAFAAAPEDGSITVNSPVVGATYNVYKVFDMTTNEKVDAFSYTIDVNNPFYGAVVAYANDAAKGLTLTRAAGIEPATYNVSVDTSKFDAQTFGKAMQAVLKDGSPAVAADADKGIVAKEAGGAAIAASATPIVADVDHSNQIKFDDLDLGYYLINPTYPDAAYGTVSLGTGANAKTFTTADLEKDADDNLVTPLALTSAAKEKTDAYATATVTDAYVDQYIADHHITTNKDGTPLTDAGKAEYKADLLTQMKADAQTQVLAAFDNQLAGSAADINVKEPIMVFLDSSQPDAVINEKNEIDKWDVPVNPTADTQPGTPDHGEPNGGKNIIVQEATETTPAYSADWSEAEIGESVHYQLRVNAMNFIRTGSGDDSIEQVKEYFLADYQSGHMHYDDSKGIKVTVWAGDDANDSQASTKTNVTKKADGTAAEFLDYSDAANVAKFFKNTTDEDAASTPTNIFDPNTGIMVPWVIVSQDATLKNTYPVYTQTNVPKFEADGTTPIYKTEEFKMENDARVPAKTASGTVITGQYVSVNDNIINGQGQLLDENNQPIQDYDTYYVYSLYNSDVTIVVDYWMILDDDAIVDNPGNKNYAQYAWNPVDNEDDSHNPKKPETPKDSDEPSQYGRVDEATVYTFALAWVKTDNKANQLAGAKFQLPFYVKKTKDNDGAYVFAFETLPQTFADGDSANNYTNELTTTEDSAVITIKGVEQGVYSITETEAPEGFNPLAAPFNVEAKKSGNGVTTKTETTVYLDAQGNITDSTTTTTVTYDTDKDSNVDKVPVYQFDPIVNLKGTELPSTGGIGTTIFYVVGAILVIGAGVVLITKRRMDA